MPIYEYACPKCRVVFNFLSRRVNPGHLPVCPKCGNKKMAKQMSGFAMPRGVSEAPRETEGDEGPMPNLDDPRVMRAMNEMERDMANLDENNPKHMAHVMRKMKDILPCRAPFHSWRASRADRPGSASAPRPLPFRVGLH